MKTITPLIVLGTVALILIVSFLFPTPASTQQASVASAQTQSFVFTRPTLTVEEGKSVRIVVKANGPITTTTRIPLTIQSGTAKRGSDFTSPTTATVTFYKGRLTEKSIVIRTRTDALSEQSETFTVSSRQVQGTVTVTIREKGTGTGGTSGVSGLPGYCGEYYNGVTRPVPTDPAFKAYGLKKVEVSLEEANRKNSYFKLLDNSSYVPSYRDGIDHILPGWHLKGQNAGSYLAIPMTPTAAGKQWSFLWYENQDSMLNNTNVVVSLSPCPGDFRAGILRNNTGDKYLGFDCRFDGTAEPFGRHTFAVEGSGWQGCPIPAGETLYLNITNHQLPHSPVNASCENGVCTPGVTITTPKSLCLDEGKPCGMRFQGLPYGVNIR